MTEDERLTLLRHDLQRTGNLPGDDAYLTHLLQAAQRGLERQGIKPSEDPDWDQLIIGTAAWIYRKRISGETEPIYLRRMRLNMLFGQKMGGV